MFRRSTFKFDFPCGTNWNEFIRNSLIQHVYATSYRADGVQFLAKERNVSRGTVNTDITKNLYIERFESFKSFQKKKKSLTYPNRERSHAEIILNPNRRTIPILPWKAPSKRVHNGPHNEFSSGFGKGRLVCGTSAQNPVPTSGRATLGFQLLRSSRGRAESAVIRQGRCNDPEMVIPWKVPERMPNPKVTLNARPSVVAGVDNSTRRIV